MQFQSLAPNLHQVADDAADYFRREHGAKKLVAEQPVRDVNSLRPTLSGALPDHSIICVEVAERAYTPSLDAFVLDCSARSLPVRLFVALPAASDDPDFSKNLKTAKERGVGIVEMGQPRPTVLCEAVPLSLFALRAPDLARFPPSPRAAIRQAHSTFRNGDPVKGCQAACEQLEALTRAFTKYALDQGWLTFGGGRKAINLDQGSWAKVLEMLGHQLDRKASRPKCPLVTNSLIAKAQALTGPRNATSHHPTTLAQLIARDQGLRTLFEQSCDVLSEWCAATKALRLWPK